MSINQKTVKNIRKRSCHSVKGIKKKGAKVKVIIKPRFYS